MSGNRTRAATLGGALVAAFAASACCLGPLVLALLGIGGAGALVALEPYRPLFTVLTVALLCAAWVLTLRAERRRAPAAPGATGDDCGCEMPRASRAGRRALWIATVAALLALAFPYLAPVIFS